MLFCLNKVGGDVVCHPACTGQCIHVQYRGVGLRKCNKYGRATHDVVLACTPAEPRAPNCVGCPVCSRAACKAYSVCGDTTLATEVVRSHRRRRCRLTAVFVSRGETQRAGPDQGSTKGVTQRPVIEVGALQGRALECSSLVSGGASSIDQE